MCLRPLLIWSGSKHLANPYFCWIQYEQKQEFIQLNKKLSLIRIWCWYKKETIQCCHKLVQWSRKDFSWTPMSTFFFANKTPPPTFSQGPDILNAKLGSTNCCCWCGSDVEGIGEVSGGRGGESVFNRFNQWIFGEGIFGKVEQKLEISSDDGEELGGVEQLLEIIQRISFLFLGELFQGIARA